MGTPGWLQLAVFAAVVAALTKPLGGYLYSVLEGPTGPMPRLERALYRLCAVDGREQTWQQYAGALLAFSFVSVLVIYAIQRFQAVLPLNPQKLRRPLIRRWRSTPASSFTTNTNWQAYRRRVDDELPHADGRAGLAQLHLGGGGHRRCARPGARASPAGQAATGSGNFWVDLDPLDPLRAPPRLGRLRALPRLAGRDPELRRLPPTSPRCEGAEQTLALGPVASQEAIKLLGTNGGGFFNANSAHPFENPTPLTNFVQMVLIFAIPAALTYTYGRMAGEHAAGLGALRRHGRRSSSPARWRAHWPRRARTRRSRGSPSTSRHGNMEGKEARFGVSASALFATVTTDASCGAVNAMHDSFTPLGGLVPLVNIQLGEVIFGGVGAGLYGMLVMVVLSRLHRRPDGGPHAGVPGQEDRSARDEAGDALRARLPAPDPRPRGLGGGDARGRCLRWAMPARTA